MLVKMNKMKNQKGFTLIELMIVVAIIGILAAIAIPQFAAYRERAYIAAMKGDVNSVRTAEEAYFVDCDHYVAASVTEGAGQNLSDYGVKGASKGVTVTATAPAGTPPSFTVSAANTDQTAKTVTYDSTTGQTTVQ